MSSVGLGEALAERVHDVAARSEALVARSGVLVDASHYAREEESHVPRCATCGRVSLGGVWLRHGEVPPFVRRVIETRGVDGICPTCFATQLPLSTDDVVVHAGDQRTADRLADELRPLQPRQGSDHILAVAVPARDPGFLPDLLTRLAECIEANALHPVQVRIGSHSYLLEGR